MKLSFFAAADYNSSVALEPAENLHRELIQRIFIFWRAFESMMLQCTAPEGAYSLLPDTTCLEKPTDTGS